jgi:hypothetical protein
MGSIPSFCKINEAAKEDIRKTALLPSVKLTAWTRPLSPWETSNIRRGLPPLGGVTSAVIKKSLDAIA